DVSNGSILDLTGDGNTDLVFSAPFSAARAGKVVFYRSLGPPGDAWEVIHLDGPGAGPRLFGGAVAAAGGLDGAGYTELIVGTFVTDDTPGSAHLYRGARRPMAMGWNGPAASQRIDLVAPDGNPRFGSAVAGLGDVNGDGYADFLVASPPTGVAGGGAA